MLKSRGKRPNQARKTPVNENSGLAPLQGKKAGSVYQIGSNLDIPMNRAGIDLIETKATNRPVTGAEPNAAGI